MEEKNKDGFSYTYSAKEQAEVRSIREKYTSKGKSENKMERLRYLDSKVTQKARAVALVFGIIGVLIMGGGMSLVMSDFNEILGAYKDMAMLIGITVGIVGCILISLAYPMYNITLKHERKKVAPEIIRLTDDLMK